MLQKIPKPELEDHQQLSSEGFKWFWVEFFFFSPVALLEAGERPSDLSQLPGEGGRDGTGRHGAFLLGTALMWCVCVRMCVCAFVRVSVCVFVVCHACLLVVIKGSNHSFARNM